MIKAKLLEALGQGSQHREPIHVEGVEDKLFLRPLTAAQREKVETGALRGKFTWRAGMISQALVDENDDPIFNIDNQQDVAALENLPVAQVDKIYLAANEISNNVLEYAQKKG